jgi:putative endonuclease
MKAPHLQTGQEGEKKALEFLQNSGYQILEINWRSKHLEIDIVAQKSGMLIIIEVKTRENNDFGFPEHFVNKSKQQKLIRAADAYLDEKNIDMPVRYDIIAVSRIQNNWQIEHFEDAFMPFDL